MRASELKAYEDYAKELKENFIKNPSYERVVSYKTLKFFLLRTQGIIENYGASYDIKNKSLGAGTYLVFLKQRKAN